MSYKKCTIIGPYLVLTEIPITEVEKKELIKTCVNRDCEVHGRKLIGNFCSICGYNIENVTFKKTVTEKLNIHQVMSDYSNQDVFFEPEYINALIPNLSYQEDCSVYIDSDDYGSIKELPSKEEGIQALEKAENYIPFFKYLTDLGIKYEIKYGIVTYSI